MAIFLGLDNASMTLHVCATPPLDSSRRLPTVTVDFDNTRAFLTPISGIAHFRIFALTKRQDTNKALRESLRAAIVFFVIVLIPNGISQTLFIQLDDKCKLDPMITNGLRCIQMSKRAFPASHSDALCS
jgi:hypothetical protein